MNIGSIIFALFICLVWGGFAAAIKIGFQGIPPFYSGGVRFLISSIILIIWSKINRIPFFPNTSLLPLIITGVISGVQISSAYIGIFNSTASHSVILINTQPFIVAILAHFYLSNERLNLGKILGLFLGLLGVTALFGRELEPLVFKGDIYNLISAFLWGINTVYIKKIIDRFDPLVIVLWQIAFSSIFLFALGGLFEGNMNLSLSFNVMLAIIYLSVLCTAFGFVAWTHLLKREQASKLSSFTVVVPCFGVMLSWIVLGEAIDINIILGVFLIGIGIYAVNRW